MNNERNIEDMLMSGKRPTLSADEKSIIKSTLLDHARTSLAHEKASSRASWSWFLIRGTGVFASLLLVFVGTAYASQGSLPGQPLYAMKVNVTEEVIALTKIDPTDRVAYDVSLMETRLQELQTLADQPETPEPEDLALVADQIDEHIADVSDTLHSTETSVIPHEEKIKTLSKLSGIAKAQAKVTHADEDLSQISESIDDTRDVAADTLNSAVEDFAHERPVDSVNDYLSKQISTVSEQMQASSTNEETRSSAEQHLHDVDESLNEGNTTDALVSALEAEQTIAVNSYLNEDTNESQQNEDETNPN